MKAQKTVFIYLDNLWTILLTLSNSHMFAAIVYTVSARVTKKCRISGLVHEYPELQKTVVRQVSLNSDYQKRITNQLIREGKDLSEYKQGENSMPIDFCKNNKVIGTYDNKKVICFYPIDGKNAKVLHYLNNGITIQKNALKGLDIFPKYYAPTNQGIEEKRVEINKMYFENLKSISVNGIRYIVVN